MKIFLLSCLAALLLTGCAGLVAPFIKNPYAGTYSGTFTTSDGKAGPASVSLTNIGNVFGDLTNTATGEVGKLTGSVDTHLVFNGHVAFTSSGHDVGGTFKKLAGGKLTGTLTGPGGYTLTLNIDPKP